MGEPSKTADSKFSNLPAFGPIFFDDGSTYIGQFKNGQRFGFGKCAYPDGACYFGEWMNDVRWGKGAFGFSNGDIFLGTFIKDMAEGEGMPQFQYLTIRVLPLL